MFCHVDKIFDEKSKLAASEVKQCNLYDIVEANPISLMLFLQMLFIYLRIYYLKTIVDRIRKLKFLLVADFCNHTGYYHKMLYPSFSLSRRFIHKNLQEYEALAAEFWEI